MRRDADGAIVLDQGEVARVRTGQEHAFRLPVRRAVMTIAFLVDAKPDSEFPRFVLESDDGSYRAEKGPKDDLVEGDAWLELRFEGLRAGPRYRLTRRDGPDEEERLFEGVPYEDVIDQPRRASPLRAAAVSSGAAGIHGEPGGGTSGGAAP